MNLAKFFLGCASVFAVAVGVGAVFRSITCHAPEKYARWNSRACAIVFKDDHCEQYVQWWIGKGETASDLKKKARYAGDWNDLISSIVVLPGCTLRVYENKNYEKNEAILQRGKYLKSNLKSLPVMKNGKMEKKNLHDKISSLKCFC